MLEQGSAGFLGNQVVPVGLDRLQDARQVWAEIHALGVTEDVKAAHAGIAVDLRPFRSRRHRLRRSRAGIAGSLRDQVSGRAGRPEWILCGCSSG